jgi:ribosomal protein S8E
MKSNRTISGAKRMAVRRCDKKLAWKGGDAAETIVSDTDRRKKKSTKGSTVKVKQLRAKNASITISGQKKAIKAEILTVVENKANRLFTRKNIITKGATIKVMVDGKEQMAKVTSRPGQSGAIQAVLEKAA